MIDFETDLGERLGALKSQDLYRRLTRVDSAQSRVVEMDGRSLLNFSSNDYLGLASEPAVKEAAIHAVERFGAGAGASRLLSGSLAPHHALEEALAQFKGTEAALCFSTGYATALGTLGSLLKKEDVVILDKRVHACVVDAARLCGARLRVFAHNDLNDLEHLLKWAAARQPPSRTLVVTESVFSMDGDAAPLRDLISLKEKHGAWLMVDEAHATGLYGAHGRGLAEECGVEDRIEIRMGTLGKAVGASGGFICGSRRLIDLLVNGARSFIFSTAPVPAAAAAATAGLQFIQSPAGANRRAALWQRVADLKARWKRNEAEFRSAILPRIIGDEAEAVRVAFALRERGFFLPAVRYPTVARGEARLRLTLTALHTADDVARVDAALEELKPRL